MGFPLSQSHQEEEVEDEAEAVYDDFRTFSDACMYICIYVCMYVCECIHMSMWCMNVVESDANLADGPSKAGYTEAWEALKEKLEHGDDAQSNEYRFIAENSMYNPSQRLEEEDISNLFQRGVAKHT